MPTALTADRAVKEIAEIYIKGDKNKGMRAHILPVIQSAAGNRCVSILHSNVSYNFNNNEVIILFFCS